MHDNWTVVDILYREFYTGSDTDLTKEERKILESLFTTKYYVNLEQEYGHMTMMGEKNASRILPKEYEEWEDYLNKYRDLIVTGTHFTTFAVQQPAGTMILSARYGEQTKNGHHSEFNPYFGTGKMKNFMDITKFIPIFLYLTFDLVFQYFFKLLGVFRCWNMLYHKTTAELQRNIARPWILGQVIHEKPFC